jgi:hypothetical protein
VIRRLQVPGNARGQVGEPRRARGIATRRLAASPLQQPTQPPALVALLAFDRCRVEAIYGAGLDDEDASRAILDPERAARATLHKAWCDYHLSRIGEARDLLDRIAELLNPRRHPRLALASRCGLAWCAIALAAPDADRRLAAAIQLADRLGDEADRLRLRRAEAHIDLMAGERGPAEEMLRATAAGLLQLNLGVDAALAFLDLGALYLREGASEAVFRQLAADILPVFAAPEVGREAMVHLLWFQQACETGSLTPGIVAGVSRGVEKSRRPSLDWWSAAGTALLKGGTGDAGNARTG